MKVSIVLPTLNEKANISPLISSIQENMSEYEIELLVVDDQSNDGTPELVQELKQKYSNLHLLNRKKRGLTSAIMEGIDNTTGDIVCWMDTDMSHPPELLPHLVGPIVNQDLDVAVASRFLPGSQDFTHIGSPARKLRSALNFILNFFCRVFLCWDYRDYTSGFIAIRRSALNEISFDGVYNEYFLEIIYKLKKRGLKVGEFPYISLARVAGEPKVQNSPSELLKKVYRYSFKIIDLLSTQN